MRRFGSGNLGQNGNTIGLHHENQEEMRGLVDVRFDRMAEGI